MPALYDPLTAAELRVVRALGTWGACNKVTAFKLGVAEQTVKVHLRAILNKVGLTNRTELAIWAVHHGLAKPDLNAPNPRLPGDLA